MTAVDENDSSLVTKCLDFCQALTSQGTAFNFSISIGSSFSFSLDTRKKVLALGTQGKTKKKPSPSTVRRNARRREDFLKKKQNPAPESSARPLHIHPSPTAASDRRQVVTLGKSNVIPSFSQLDGTASLSPPPASPSSSPSPPPPFDQPCTGQAPPCTSGPPWDICMSSTDPEAGACWQTSCDNCGEKLCSYHSIAEKCKVNCGSHHCHKQVPGGDVWSFMDANCGEHEIICCPPCHCSAYPCPES